MKKLMISVVAVAALVQSTPSFADKPADHGMCYFMPHWTSPWLPCDSPRRP
jgi:hypothetical protein